MDQSQVGTHLGLVAGLAPKLEYPHSVVFRDNPIKLGHYSHCIFRPADFFSGKFNVSAIVQVTLNLIQSRTALVLGAIWLPARESKAVSRMFMAYPTMPVAYSFSRNSRTQSVMGSLSYKLLRITTLRILSP